MPHSFYLQQQLTCFFVSVIKCFYICSAENVMFLSCMGNYTWKRLEGELQNLETNTHCAFLLGVAV